MQKLSQRLLPVSIALSIVALVLAFSLGGPSPARGQGAAGASTNVFLDPPAQALTAGGNASVQVRGADITEPDGLGAYEVALLFDPSVLGFGSFVNGPFLASTGRSVICLPAVFDQDLDTVPDPGYVRVGCVTSGNPDGPTGSGLLGTLTFTTSCAGMSGVTFDLSGLSDPLGHEIVHTETTATVTVTGGAECQPFVRAGDADCDDNVTAVDATLILQNTAGTLDPLPCPQNGDADGNATTNAVDALVVLQFVVGLLDQLPP